MGIKIEDPEQEIVDAVSSAMGSCSAVCVVVNAFWLDGGKMGRHGTAIGIKPDMGEEVTTKIYSWVVDKLPAIVQDFLDNQRREFEAYLAAQYDGGNKNAAAAEEGGDETE